MKNMQKLMNVLQCDHPSWILLQIRKILVFIPIVLIKIVIIVVLLKMVFVLYVSTKKTLQKRTLLKLIFGIFVCSVIWYGQNQLLTKKIAFVVKESAFVYAGPEQSFHAISQLKLGTCVQLLKCQSQMCYISIDGQSGWIVSQDIEIQ